MTAAALAKYAAETSYLTDAELISVSPAARNADELFQQARERCEMYRDLLAYGPLSRTYREEHAIAARELEEAAAARGKALDRVWARFQRAREALALTAA